MQKYEPGLAAGSDGCASSCQTCMVWTHRGHAHICLFVNRHVASCDGVLSHTVHRVSCDFENAVDALLKDRVRCTV